MTRLVTTAQPITRQAPQAISTSGSRGPNCGLIVSNPSSTPASTWRPRPRQARNPASRAATRRLLWPWIAHIRTAGEATAMIGMTVPGTSRPSPIQNAATPASANTTQARLNDIRPSGRISAWNWGG